MKLFSGYFKTSDGRKWSVAFRAHSWDDAFSLADLFGVTVEGTLVATYDADTGEEKPGVAHFAAWNCDGERFYQEVETP